MEDRELWSFFQEHQVARSHPFDREFLWIKKENFEVVQNLFIKEVNIVHSGRSFRSRNYFFHIHAVEQGEFVFVHRDVGNLARFLPLGLVHLVVDVMPYVGFACLQRKSFKTIFAFPKT